MVADSDATDSGELARELNPAKVQRWTAYALCGTLALLSLGREFGTDIGNYRAYFSDPTSLESTLSLEPMYRVVATTLETLGISPERTIEIIAFASFALLAVFVTRAERPLPTLLIGFGWLLFQQYWGTIRSGLAITYLLFADRLYLREGRFPKRSLLGMVFHWSMLLHPIAYLLRLSVRVALVASTAAFIGVIALGSIKTAFFELLPADWAVIANYAALQTGTAEATRPALTAFVIHIVIIVALAWVVEGRELQRFLGPLTILYIATCVFYDFEQVSGRVSNVLVGFRLLALVKIYERADELPLSSAVARIGIVMYCGAVAAQYVALHQEYF